MTWRKRRQPPRQPHPDPAVELELQRILDLRASISRRAELIDQYREEIDNLHEAARNDGNRQRMEMFLKQAGVLHQRILDTETAITTTGEQVAALAAKISPDDLAFL